MSSLAEAVPPGEEDAAAEKSMLESFGSFGIPGEYDYSEETIESYDSAGEPPEQQQSLPSP